MDHFRRSYEQKTEIRYLLDKWSKKFQNLPERVFWSILKNVKNEGNKKLKFFQPPDLVWNVPHIYLYIKSNGDLSVTSRSVHTFPWREVTYRTVQCKKISGVGSLSEERGKDDACSDMSDAVLLRRPQCPSGIRDENKKSAAADISQFFTDVIKRCPTFWSVCTFFYRYFCVKPLITGEHWHVKVRYGLNDSEKFFTVATEGYGTRKATVASRHGNVWIDLELGSSVTMFSFF